jgi:phosphoribosylcarboxyaminoimidazole (NCAIR) mutase
MNRALGSLIGMPEGKPLATFQGESGAYKAGLFATRIVAARKASVEYGAATARVCVLSESEDEAPTMSKVSQALETIGVTHEHHIIGQTLEAVDVAGCTQSIGEETLNSVVVSVSGPANLARVLAGHSKLPVLGVAVTKDQDVLCEALDAIIGTPEDKPIPAFQGESGAFNAGLFAARLLCRQDDALRDSYLAYEHRLAEAVLGKDALLSEIGAEAYLLQNKK